MKNILYLLNISDEIKLQLQEKFKDCSFVFKSKYEVSDDEIKNAECIIGG